MAGVRKFLLCLSCTAWATHAAAGPTDEIGNVFGKAKEWLDKTLNNKQEEVQPEPSPSPSPAPRPAPAAPAPGKAVAGPAASTVQEKDKDSSWTRYLLLQPAEDQAFLMEIVEGVLVGDTVLISNGLNLGVYFGRNLLSANFAFNYGSTTLESESSDSGHVRMKVEADHNALAYGFKLGREVWPFFFPYLGYSRAHYDSDISQKVELREDEDSLSLPVASFDLKNFQTSSVQIGCDARIHFWKVWTLAAGLGAEVPYSVSSLAYKKAEAYADPIYAKALADLETRMKRPMYQLNLRFGLAF